MKAIIFSQMPSSKACFWIFLICFLTRKGSGSSCWCGFSNHRFMSFPIKDHRWFPTTTPSGLIIGIIWNMTLFLSSWAAGVFPRIKFIIPWVIQLAFVSPGCTLPQISTILRAFSFSLEELKFVMISKGILRPPRLFPRSLTSIILFFLRLNFAPRPIIPFDFPQRVISLYSLAHHGPCEIQ